MTSQEAEIHEPEVVRESTALARPSNPTTINDLAAHERGLEIVQQRLQVLEALRLASIKLTMPNDWTLFKGKDDRVTAYLGDQGCDRIKKLWGIQISNLSPIDRIIDDQNEGEYACRITGDGACAVTGEAVFAMEGIRYSTEKYATEKPEGIQRLVAVQKAARANLDGSITRELAGMKSIPVEELDRAWAGTGRSSSSCNLGRGFGGGNERAGAANEQHGIDGADLPECDVCRIPLVWRNGKDGKPGFFGCKNWASHKETKVIVSLERAKEIAASKRKAATAAREPGQEG